MVTGGRLWSAEAADAATPPAVDVLEGWLNAGVPAVAWFIDAATGVPAPVAAGPGLLGSAGTAWLAPWVVLAVAAGFRVGPRGGAVSATSQALALSLGCCGPKPSGEAAWRAPAPA